MITPRPILLDELRQRALDGRTRALIFDCDGTLAHSMPLHHQAWEEALARWGVSFPAELHEAWAGQKTAEIVGRLNEMHGVAMPVDEVLHLKESGYFARLPLLTAVPVVREIVREFSGRLPMAVVSGSVHESVRKTLQVLGLEDAFDAVLGAEDYAAAKPAPDGFLRAAGLLGADPAECLVFEDGELGVRAAAAAGMACVRVWPARNEVVALF